MVARRLVEGGPGGFFTQLLTQILLFWSVTEPLVPERWHFVVAELSELWWKGGEIIQK